jgi:hypothetical protein
MRNTAEVTGGKPNAVLLQSISGVNVINTLVAFYNIHGAKRERNIIYKKYNNKSLMLIAKDRSFPNNNNNYTFLSILRWPDRKISNLITKVSVSQ